MDQAMSEIQAQLEEIRRLWETERVARIDLESQLKEVRGNNTQVGQKRGPPADDDQGEPEKRQRTE
jgi:hypothetical protein